MPTPLPTVAVISLDGALTLELLVWGSEMLNGQIFNNLTNRARHYARDFNHEVAKQTNRNQYLFAHDTLVPEINTELPGQQ